MIIILRSKPEDSLVKTAKQNGRHFQPSSKKRISRIRLVKIVIIILFVQLNVLPKETHACLQESHSSVQMANWKE